MASSKDTGPTLPGMTTCSPSERTTLPPSISSAADSLVPTYLTLAKVLASRVHNLVCGASSRESLASFDRVSSSGKTSQLSLLADSTECSVILPKAGMMRFGCLYALPTLERHTDGNGCSSSLVDPWPTASAFDAMEMKQEESPEEWQQQQQCKKRGVSKQYPLAVAAKVGMSAGQFARQWPTATKADGERGSEVYPVWPTATGRDATSGPGIAATAEGSPNLRTVVAGKLNPAWVSQLMGFPDGWTEAGPAAPAKRKPHGKPRASRKASRKGQPA